MTEKGLPLAFNPLFVSFPNQFRAWLIFSCTLKSRMSKKGLPLAFLP